AALGALAAEHRPAIVQARGGLALREPTLEVCAHDARRRLRAQRERGLVTVDERVHLLLDDVRGIAERAGEELRALDHGKPDLVEAVAPEHDRGGILALAPPPGLVRHNVAGPLHGPHRGGRADSSP